MSRKFVIEMMHTDGPHWYCGRKIHQQGGHAIAGFLWSPFWEDRMQFQEGQGDEILAILLENADGAELIPEHAAKSDQSRALLRKEDGLYRIQARYLSKGNVVKREGVLFNVLDKTDSKFILHDPLDEMPSYLDVDSKEWVIVVRENYNQYA